MTESTTANSFLGGVMPPFSMDKSRYNMDNYLGRTAYFFHSINPLLLLETASTLKVHKERIEAAKKGELPKGKFTDAELWDSRMKVEACIHPVSGEVIPQPFRMAAFVPVNFMIVPIMMLPSTIRSVYRTIAIHWINQSFNALINYSNRGSDSQPTETILKAYVVAVSVALTGALSATFAMRRLPSGTPLATVIRATLPMCAVASSGCANVAFMRTNEWWFEGVRVKDEDGNEVGRSIKAGQKSLYECAVARVLWNIPCMTLPPLLAAPLLSFPMLHPYPQLVELLLIYFGLVIGVPPALAYYPLVEHAPVVELEEEFRHMKRKNGEPVKMVSFLKGL